MAEYLRSCVRTLSSIGKPSTRAGTTMTAHSTTLVNPDISHNNTLKFPKESTHADTSSQIDRLNLCLFRAFPRSLFTGRSPGTARRQDRCSGRTILLMTSYAVLANFCTAPYSSNISRLEFCAVQKSTTCSGISTLFCTTTKELPENSSSSLSKIF